ncbi:MAG: ATP synthase subunit I [Ignavibacteria bacterium]
MISILRNLLIFNLIPFILSFLIISDHQIEVSIFWGWLVVFVSIGIGVLSFELAKEKENKSFLKIYFGGMIIRLILLLFLIFVILKYIGINPLSFLFSLFIFYVINQIIELRYISKSLRKIKYD